MELTLTRRILTKNSTIGELFIDGKRECFVLEDTYRVPPAAKVPGATCIPCGRYSVRKTFSPRFKQDMYLVENVPGFQGIRIHPGNTKDDTEGCLLPGRTMGLDKVGESRLAFADLVKKLDAANTPIFITIKLA